MIVAENTTFLIREPAETYHAKANEYLSSHQLGDFRKCPLLYHRKKHGHIAEEERPAYTVGRAAHTLILEGLDRFEEDFAVGGPINPKTGQPFGANTKTWTEWAEAIGKPVLTDAQFDMVARMNEAVRTHPVAMGLLIHQIQSGRTQMPPRIMTYGTEGIGKSTLAAGTPRPIFVQTEDGLGEIDCDKFPLARTFDDALAALNELATESHSYETVVIDSLDWLERMIWDAVCKRESATTIEKVGGGYGKGYILALDFWRKFIDRLVALHSGRQMMVFLIAHAKVEKFEDPEAPAYDRYSPRLHKHAAALITEWCDAVLFGSRRFTTRSEDAGFGRQRAIAAPIGAGGGERILRTSGGPSCVAKNRYRLKPEIPLSWDAIVTGILGNTNEATNSNPNLSMQGELTNG